VSFFRHLVEIASVGACLLGAVHAQTPSQAGTSNQATSGPRSWSSLTPSQQTALQPLQREWNSIDSPRKSKWIEVADRFSALTPAERARVQGRMAEWAQLSPRERGQTRLNFKEAQVISPQERKAKWEAYNALPAEERQQLAARALPASSPTNGNKLRPGTATSGKLNTVPVATSSRPQAIAPSVAQAQPGATTNLVTRRPAPPAHQQSGLPKIITSASLVDNTTLLPKARAQNAASAAASAPTPARQ